MKGEEVMVGDEVWKEAMEEAIQIYRTVQGKEPLPTSHHHATYHARNQPPHHHATYHAHNHIWHIDVFDAH